MKAILLRQDGFRKYIEVFKKYPYIRSPIIERASMTPVIYRDPVEFVPILEYQFLRSFVNEFDEEILIYKEI